MDLDEDSAPKEAPTESGSLVAVRAQFRTRSRPQYTRQNRDKANYDEMGDLNLGFESTALKRSVFPASWRLFKPSSSNVGQQRRREEALNRCKEARYQMTIKSRKIMDAFKTEDQLASSSSSNSSVSPMDGSQADTSYSETKFIPNTDIDAKFANSLMLPEYLGEIPPDFSVDWCCRPFPSGVRCTVLARGGRTQSRDIDGILLDEFQSLLPCGSVYNTSSSGTSSTILDCVMVEAVSKSDSTDKKIIYFVLDLMAWNGKFYYNSSAESRFWMLTNWISDLDGIDSVIQDAKTLRNDRHFLCLPLYSTEISDLQQAVKSPQIIPFLDNTHGGSNEDTWRAETNDSKQYDPNTTYFCQKGVQYSTEGIMFYFKDMDYIDEQTPVMCVLPIEAARMLLQAMTHGAPSV